jgi:SlyX protein
MATDPGIETRLEELESRLAFQDDLIENLNEVVARQDRDIARLLQRLKELNDKLVDIAESSAAGGASPGHEVPPHY